MQTQGPLSRAEVARHTGLGYATAVKICESLESGGFAESCAGREQSLAKKNNGAGRPGNYLRMAVDKARVIALAIVPLQVQAVTVGFDGAMVGEMQSVPTPGSYPVLLDQIKFLVDDLKASSGTTLLLGLGVCIPGMIDATNGKVLKAPNVPVVDGHDLFADLEALTGLKPKLIGVMEAQFLVEQIRGQAAEFENSVIINYRGGLGVAAACDGHRIEGARGMAGELGHVVVERDGGVLCGCGNRGCLETRATDLALAERVSEKLGRPVSVAGLLKIQQETPEDIADEVERFLDYLAIAVGLVMQAYNPSAVFLLGHFLETDDDAFARLIERLPRFCLGPLLENCEIRRTSADPLNGAGLAAIEELIANIPTNA